MSPKQEVAAPRRPQQVPDISAAQAHGRHKSSPVTRCRTAPGHRLHLVRLASARTSLSGRVVTDVSLAPDKITTLAMYERYDKTALISFTDVDKLLSDPRMASMTYPVTNKADNSIEI